MDLGLGFDDSDFERKEKVTAGVKTSYNAKVQTPLWFEEEGTDDPTMYIHQQKFSADYHFYHGKYEAAAAKYKALIELIPENNLPLQQDVQESLCRSYTKLGRHQESTDIAYRLVTMMREVDEARQRQTLLLLSQACRAAGDWTGCIDALEELVHRQSHYAHFWLELARAYQRHFQDRGDRHEHYVKIITCYICARSLFESVVNTVGKVARERNESSIHQIDKEVKELGVEEQFVDRATEAVRADLEHNSSVGDDDEEENSASAGSTFSSDAFRKRWFSWADKAFEKT